MNPPQFFVSSWVSEIEVPIALGVTGYPWQEDVQWSAGIRYKMAWPYELGWGDGFFRYPESPVYRFGLMVQRSATWPERWERVGWDVTLLQSYEKGVNVLPYEVFWIDILPGLHYRLPLSWGELKFWGGPGLNVSFGYVDALLPDNITYQLLVHGNFALGTTLIWDRNKEQAK